LFLSLIVHVNEYLSQIQEALGFSVTGASTYTPNTPVMLTVGGGVFCGVLLYAEVSGTLGVCVAKGTLCINFLLANRQTPVAELVSGTFKAYPFCKRRRIALAKRRRL
jgi:hypothetical protein